MQANCQKKFNLICTSGSIYGQAGLIKRHQEGTSLAVKRVKAEVHDTGHRNLGILIRKV